MLSFVVFFLFLCFVLIVILSYQDYEPEIK